VKKLGVFAGVTLAMLIALMVYAITILGQPTQRRSIVRELHVDGQDSEPAAELDRMSRLGDRTFQLADLPTGLVAVLVAVPAFRGVVEAARALSR